MDTSIKVGNRQTQRRDFSAMSHPVDNNQTSVELLSYDYIVLLISPSSGITGIPLINDLEPNMSNNESNEHFLAANKSVIDAMTSATRAILAATENLVALNFETAREAFDASAENAQALLSSKNPQEATALQSALGKTAVEKAAAYSRGVYEVSTKAASELGSLFQSQLEALTKVSQEITQKAAKASPFGADFAQAAAKQAAQFSESYITAVSSVLHNAGAKRRK